MKPTEMRKIAHEMNSRIVDIVNEFELTTGWTVDDFTITRVSDHRTAVISVKPFVYYSIPNRQRQGDQDV